MSNTSVFDFDSVACHSKTDGYLIGELQFDSPVRLNLRGLSLL